MPEFALGARHSVSANLRGDAEVDLDYDFEESPRRILVY